MIEKNDLFEWTVWSMTGRDMPSIDAFLSDAAGTGVWNGSNAQGNLAHLLELREKALHAYASENMPLMEANIEALHAWCTSIGYRYEAHGLAIQGNRSKKAHRISASAGRKLEEAQWKSIAKEYWFRKRNGGGYGATKEIASRFDVSTQTVRDAAKRYEPD